jgi:hypothetical protein
MKATRPKDVPAEVRREQKQFKRWRAGKRGSRRIPPGLWEAAAKLCETYSVHRVSRWLHLNHTALQKRAGKQPGPRSCRPKPNFVEWSLPAGSLPGVSSVEYVVEVPGRRDVAQCIHVRGASVSEVAALVRALGAEGIEV